MKAVGFTKKQIENGEELMSDINLPIQHPTGYDLLVEVKAVSVNPVDYKIRNLITINDNEWKVVGYDASGIVKEIGDKVKLFKPGDEVWYAGDVNRQGSNQQFQLVDEHIVGYKPKSLTFAEAAALPLTSLFSWELLFDRMHIPKSVMNPQKSVLIIGAAGGVGSLMVQLLQSLTDVIVIATAGNNESKEWLFELGANYVINHNNSLTDELKNINFQYVDYVIGLNKTDEHLNDICQIIAPEGYFGLSDPRFSLDLGLMAFKSVTICLEVMFTRTMFKLNDMIKQHKILNNIAEMVDKGEIKTTLAYNLGKINAENIMKAYDMLKTHEVHGKIVLENF